MKIVKPEPKGPPVIASNNNKESSRADVKNKFEFYRVNGLTVGVALVNCDTNILENVAAYAAYVEALVELGATILGISSQMAQMGLVDKRVVTQFIITYRLPEPEPAV